jgi:predicted aldo/keto reductase-like oxidoreductase
MKSENAMTRRELLAAASDITASSAFLESAGSDQSKGEIPYRTLGRTDEKVSIIGLGGYHLGGQPSEKESIKIIRTAIDNGINFLDNSWDYHEGASEIRMGKALQDGYRQKAFLMTKIDGRDEKTATKQIEESLKRLRTETIDLLQFHEVIRDSDPDLIFRPNGAIRAVIKAKQSGKIRYIGFTGHKSPDFHLKMLETALENDFIFDTVQMPLNVMDAHYESFEKRVLPALLKHRIGVLGMKPLSAGVILTSKTVTAEECLRYALSLPVSVVITGCDSPEILEQALNVARNFRPLTEAQIASLLAKTAEVAAGGKFERYKTSNVHDATDHWPEWLGDVS